LKNEDILIWKIPLLTGEAAEKNWLLKTNSRVVAQISSKKCRTELS